MNFYKSAALAIDYLDKHQGSVKGSLAGAGVQTASQGEAKRILALVIETLKYRPVLQELLKTVPIIQLEKLTFPKKTPPRTPTSSNLILVLLHDLLFSSKTRIEASDLWPPKSSILRHQASLRSELVRLQIRAGASRKEDLAKTTSGNEGRYVRYNPNVDLHRAGDWSLDALVRHLPKKGLERLDEAVWPVPEGKWFMDDHLGECLLVFGSRTSWWVGDEWYEAGAVILQDKASCFPAKVLMEGWEEGEGDCLDATAAPGNKTSYVSALMGDKGKLYAFEKSHLRYKTLEKMLATAQCRNVKARRADFTESDPASREFSKVTRILLDPSCSGSGIVNRLDYLLDTDETDETETDAKAERLEKLASFQLQMILHAFKFPAANRIVYSTCSIHAEEDEQVVMAALNSRQAEEGAWRLAPRSSALPTWERRGRPDEMGGDTKLADSVIRCLPGEDKTNGFFVACFVRGATEEDSPDVSISHKRPLEQDLEAHEDEDGDEDEDEHQDDEQGVVGAETGESVKQLNPSFRAQPKSQAQLERARRKRQKQQQKKKQKIVL